VDDLQAQFKQQIDEYLASIQDRIQELFQQGIQESIYNYYPDPIQYDRNYTFLNSVKAHIDLENGIMYVYNDLNEGSQYYSAVDGTSQFQNISNWLENGHNDGIGESIPKENQYHQFEGRRYLEHCRDLIQSEFPDLQIKILDNEEI
jgi:predicted ATP-binding protein involved in virulence